MTNLKEIKTSDLQVYSARLFSYYDELKRNLESINHVESSGMLGDYDFKQIKANINAEIGKINITLTKLNDEIQERMSSDLGINLNDDEIFSEISNLYEIVNSIQQQEILKSKNANLTVQ